MSDILLQPNSLQVLAPIGSLEVYVNWLHRIPMLTAAEEMNLAKRFQDEGDLDAARKLVLTHMRFVIRIAQNYSGYGLAQADLIQEGSIGLMKAVKRFNPALGVRLISFAVHWIKAEIHEFILRNWRIVKIATTKAQRKLFFNLRKLTKRLGWCTEAEIQYVANELNVSPNDVRVMEARLINNTDVAFEAHDDDSDESYHNAPENCLEDFTFNPEKILLEDDAENNMQESMRRALASLDIRSREILKSRWLSEKKATLQELAAKYKVSAERIRQLEQSAMNQIKKILVTEE